MTGHSSVLEHGVPEAIFGSQAAPAEGISAVKALMLAAKQGQRIYHISSSNAATVLPNLSIDDAALMEIRQGLQAGKEVIAHTNRISVPGFTGEGYIIYDPTPAYAQHTNYGRLSAECRGAPPLY